MADNPQAIDQQKTLGEALEEYVKTLKPEVRTLHATYVRKFVEHYGESNSIASITGSRVESFAEANIKPSDPAAAERVTALKTWFQYLKKQNYAAQNFGIHIRVRRTGANRPSGGGVRVEEQPIEMTADGIEALKGELGVLQSRVPDLVGDIARAREDKDFRENSPLEAAREALAYNEGRRKEIERTLRRAVVVDRKGDDASNVGSIVTVTKLDDGRQYIYRLVGPREANAKEMKISVDSPVGKQLLGRRAGEEVSVSVPSGVIEYRVDSVAQG